jgi:hypothetical protein
MVMSKLGHLVQCNLTVTRNLTKPRVNVYLYWNTHTSLSEGSRQDESTTPIAIGIAKEESIEKLELRPVIPIMLKVGAHAESKINTRHVCIELVARRSVQKVHVRYSDKFCAIQAVVIEWCLLLLGVVELCCLASRVVVSSHS